MKTVTRRLLALFVVMSSASTFVGWQRRDSSATWARPGVLTSDEGHREGKFMANVPAPTFEVTAERKTAPSPPGSDVVFFQGIN
jgi:hypothetical protein